MASKQMPPPSTKLSQLEQVRQKKPQPPPTPAENINKKKYSVDDVNKYKQNNDVRGE